MCNYRQRLGVVHIAIVDVHNKERGVTSIVVTHDLHSALSISTRIAMLGGGKVLSIEPPSSFIHSTLPQARAFLEAQYITRRGAWEANRP